MRAILHLCESSLQQRISENEKQEAAECDQNAEKGVIYDDENEEDNLLEGIDDESDDEEFDLDEESDSEQLYDTLFDKVDEILLVRDALNSLSAKCNEHYSFMMGQLDNG